MLYIFAAVVFFGSLIGYRRAPEYERMARLLYTFGMIAGVAIAVLGYVMFNVAILGGNKTG